jgi:hypothetical protein
LNVIAKDETAFCLQGFFEGYAQGFEKENGQEYVFQGEENQYDGEKLAENGETENGLSAWPGESGNHDLQEILLPCAQSRGNGREETPLVKGSFFWGSDEGNVLVEISEASDHVEESACDESVTRSDDAISWEETA